MRSHNQQPGNPAFQDSFGRTFDVSTGCVDGPEGRFNLRDDQQVRAFGRCVGQRWAAGGDVWALLTFRDALKRIAMTNPTYGALAELLRDAEFSQWVDEAGLHAEKVIPATGMFFDGWFEGAMEALGLEGEII
ncbi:MAG: hypothetical protein H6807_14050 [Planctomycetes bacterium]|nr:hypothetical protein [Planctomycetota bacterium]